MTLMRGGYKSGGPLIARVDPGRGHHLHAITSHESVPKSNPSPGQAQLHGETQERKEDAARENLPTFKRFTLRERPLRFDEAVTRSGTRGRRTSGGCPISKSR